MLDCAETELDFYSRRAMEEAHAAAHARSPSVGAAHRHMAAAYAARLRDEQQAEAWLDDLLGALDTIELDALVLGAVTHGGADLPKNWGD
jgi:hypothetical protein